MVEGVQQGPVLVGTFIMVAELFVYHRLLFDQDHCGNRRRPC